jgi:hypothetical protein
MGTFTVTFLSRDEQGRFTKRHKKFPAQDNAEVEAFLYHGVENGKWSIEGDVTIRGPIATRQCETHVIPH